MVPPPCEEFTTNEPSLSATLVKPPGVILILLGDTKTKGLKSMCLELKPLLVKIGTVESSNVGCAIYLFGFSNLFFLKTQFFSS